MRKVFAPTLFLLIAVLLEVAIACTQSGTSNDGTSTTQYNPASDRIGSLAGIPPESDFPSGGVIPNLTPLVDAGRLAAANIEASTVKTATHAYLADHTAPSHFSSDDLQPYITGFLNAKYYLDPTAALITRVDIVSGGWSDMVFSLSQQKWQSGTADNDHPEDQDVP